MPPRGCLNSDVMRTLCFPVRAKLVSMSASAKANQRRKPFGLALKLLFSLVAICAANVVWVVTSAAAPAIVTQDGPLKGIEVPGIDEFLGIPYAAPPLGNLRWRPPQPHARWQGVFEATHLGNFCIEPDGTGGTLGSEDCLFLNVYRPSQNEDREGDQDNGLPVMVWIHGDGTDGGFNASRCLSEKRGSRRDHQLSFPCFRVLRPSRAGC